MKTKNKKLSETSTNIGLKWYSLLIFGIIFLFYFHTKNYGLSNFDDDIIIPRIAESINDNNIFHRALTTDAMFKHTEPYYRPFQNISFITDLKISGPSETWMLHLSSVIIFCLVGVALFFLLLQFNIPEKIAFFSTLLFCVHPLFVSSVAWIPARGDLFLTLFSVLSFLFYAKFLENKKSIFLILTSFFFVLALFSKETAAFLTFAYFFYFLLKRPVKIDRSIILLGIIIFFLSLIWLYIRDLYITKVFDETTYSGRFGDIITNIQFIPTGLSLLFFPSDFTTIPSYSLMKTIIGTLAFVGLLLLAIKKPEVPIWHKLFFLSWFVLFLIPAFFVKQKFFDYLDHRFLLPSIGILILLISSIPKKYTTSGNPKIVVVFTVLIVVFASLSYIKVRPYKTPLDFCNASITKNYKQVVALNNRGSIKHNNMDFEGALEDYNEAIVVNKDYVLCYINRGGTRFMLKDYAGAVEDFKEDIKRNQHPVKSYYFLGLSYASLNNFVLAIKNLDKYIQLVRNDEMAYFHKGRILSFIKKQNDAIDSFTEAIKINPSFNEAFSERAMAKMRKGDFNGAIEDCELALKLNPENTMASTIIADANKYIENNVLINYNLP